MVKHEAGHPSDPSRPVTGQIDENLVADSEHQKAMLPTVALVANDVWRSMFLTKVYWSAGHATIISGP